MLFIFISHHGNTLARHIFLNKCSFFSALVPSGSGPGYLSPALARRGVGGGARRPHGAGEAAAAGAGLCGQM